MGKIAALCLVALSLAVSGFAQGTAFGDVVDFSVTLKDVAEAADRGETLSGQKTLLLTGSVGSVNLGDGDVFSAEVDLVGGEWIGTKEVRSYRILLTFVGERFAYLFDEEEDYPLIRNGKQLLVSGNLSGLRDNGSKKGRVAVFSVDNVRIIR